MNASTSPATRPTIAPVAPLTDEHLRFSPLGLDEVRITSGFWSDWQRTNREVTAPHSVRWIEEDGAVDAFRRVAKGTPLSAAERPGMWFSDSDVYKTLEGLAWDLGVEPSEEFTRVIGDLAREIAAAQGDDGYLNTFVQEGNGERYAKLGWSHEMYCIGHLIQAAVAHKRTTGRDDVLDIAVAAANRLVGDFGDRKRTETDGHPEIEMALVELYRVTGTREYLTLAQQFLDLRGHGELDTNGNFDSVYYQDATPFREETTTVGHAVRAVYLIAGAVDLYLETGEDALLEAAERQWESMTATKTYVNGAIGSRVEGEAFGDSFELPPDLVYGETCATIGAMMLSWRLLLATGRSRYADSIERGLFNLVAASTSAERNAFFYANPAQRRTPRPAAPVGERPPRAEAPGTRPSWFVCACCPPNILRTVASLGAYVATSNSTGVQVHQYVPTRITAPVSSGTVALEMSTGYPVDGTVRITVRASTEDAWTLSLRSPDWADTVRVAVNGEAVNAAPSPSGYLEVERRWTEGDEVTMTLPMGPRYTVTHPQTDAVRGQVAIERGPLVYCFESPDQADGVDLNRVDLLVDEPIAEDEPADLLGSTAVVLRVPAVLRDEQAWATTGWAPLDAGPGTQDGGTQDGGAHGGAGSRVELVAIPYFLWANRGPSVMRIFTPYRRG
ncbi:glycoside hydrolase family 127 protein [Planctomonas psychrotolerans]|uniref:glycoside hydrolase family 127 protein n=1 Tax=Planctomonas psychrotolerans TaxID=2528712 RepID=UPI001239C70E|nr:beta-L-arabinofuranosidase domain-containing protein [Planctomonas psychrotolerans]